MKRKQTQIVLFILGLLVSIGLDQWTKLLAVRHLKGQPPFVIADGIFELLYSENRGAAFGMLQGKQGFFFLVAAFVIVGVIYFLWKVPDDRKYTPMTICLFLIASGAIGNMIDRLMQGYVVDFLYFKLIDFPIFNVADCYVTGAAALLVVLFMFYYKDEDLAVFSLNGRKKH